MFLYISFFPQLVAGPIVRAAHFLPQIDAPVRPDAAARATAVVLILSGLFKKMVVANYLSVLLVDPVFGFPDGQNWVSTLAAVLGYAVQIYCDFSGYSDIAIGVALLLGYRFHRNFDQPYRATSLARLLAALAHLALDLDPRLSLHPARRQPRAGGCARPRR